MSDEERAVTDRVPARLSAALRLSLAGMVQELARTTALSSEQACELVIAETRIIQEMYVKPRIYGGPNDGSQPPG